MKQGIVGIIVLVLVSLGWGHASWGEQVPAPRGELRIVDKSPYNWVSITFNVFEHLVEIDQDGKLLPRLATGWQWRDERTLEMTLYEQALGGMFDWGIEKPELQRLYEQVLHTVDRAQQQALIRQMERHTRDQAYFLFLYSPIGLYAVNKAVEFVPHVDGLLHLGETSVTDEHWSVRQGAMQR